MAKKETKEGFSVQGFDARAYKKTESYVQAIDALYSKAVAEFAVIASRLNNIDPDKPFSFSDFPQTQASVQHIVNNLAAKMEAVISKGTRDQWLYACKKNDEFLATILNTSKIPKSRLEKYQNRNLEALKSFQSRKIGGLDISKRVWKYTGQLKTTMELGIDVALGEGTSAAQLSRELKKYLTDPDNLFRRVRDKRGNLHLSKAAKALHPGQGVYRSSHKNAMRLTRSEINMAYKTSDQLRWQQLDFVVGYEVKLSNNHTLNGEPFKDICDKLAGKYPKSFTFKGWHPQCRCMVVPILQDRKEFNDDELADLKSALNGKEYQKFASKNTVADVPDNFKAWIQENAERSKNWASQPYFIKDNFKGGNIDGGLKFDTSAMQIVKPVIAQPSEQITKQKSETIYTKIVKEESAIAKNKSFETAIVFDKDGNEIFRKRGAATSVSFTDDELKNLNNNIFTHNHPRGWSNPEGTIGRIGSSFSINDVAIGIRYNSAEIRAVGPVFTFVMKRPAAGWKMTTEDAINKYRKIEESVRSEFTSVINKSSYKHQDIAIQRAEVLHYHTIWKRFCSENGIEYTKIRTSL